MMVWDVPVAAQEPAGTVPGTPARGEPCACGCGLSVSRKAGARYHSDKHKRAAATRRAHETGKTTRLRNDADEDRDWGTYEAKVKALLRAWGRK
jgi:hypothetical protein